MISSELRWEIPKNIAMNSINNAAIGIDLGTTRCCCAVKRKDGISTVPIDNSGDERLLPSYIGYEEEKVKCGKLVVKRLSNFKNSAVFDVKRIIGRKFNDIFIDPNWTFSLICDNEENPLIKIQGFQKEIFLSPIEVSAALLKHVKNKAEEFQGKKLENVVITVPAVFTNYQCADTIKAAFLAEWKAVKLLPEPVAAAFTYFIDREIPNNSTLLLFDLGGGTLDVCVFKIINDKITFLSNEGDSKLGGRDFDNLLFEYFKKRLIDEFNVDNVEKKKHKLLEKCEEIKETLSSSNSDSLDVDDYDPSKDGNITVTREEFELMSQDLLKRIRMTINMALKNVKPSDINDIILVGGGSRMPMIKTLLEEFFPGIRQRCEVHPDEVVAMGAAYYACHLLSNPEMANTWITEDNLKKDENVENEKTLSDSKPKEIPTETLFTIHQGPDEVVSNRTMETTIFIDSNGNIVGTTELIAKHWIWGFRGILFKFVSFFEEFIKLFSGGVRVTVYGENDKILWEMEWRLFGTNMHSSSIRNWFEKIPAELLPSVKKATIAHKHSFEIEGKL
uniref:Heat shock protein 70 n=1 Tax=Panagrolaimus sp. ES5 TaxID=591445 RepID=A0AC34FAM8_9BILA